MPSNFCILVAALARITVIYCLETMTLAKILFLSARKTVSFYNHSYNVESRSINYIVIL